MENKVFYVGEYAVEVKEGISKKTGKPYVMYYLVMDTPIGEQRFLIDKRTEMGIVLTTICKMC